MIEKHHPKAIIVTTATSGVGSSGSGGASGKNVIGVGNSLKQSRHAMMAAHSEAAQFKIVALEELRGGVEVQDSVRPGARGFHDTPAVLRHAAEKGSWTIAATVYAGFTTPLNELFAAKERFAEDAI